MSFDIIYNPTFQFISATILTFIIYFRQRQRKELSYKIVSFGPLLSRKDGLVQKLQVLYEGKQILDPHLAIVRIANTGNVPIKSADFESKMSLNFDIETQVFSAEISKKIPHNLEANLEFTHSQVILKPTLLNKYDSVTITMLTSSKDNIRIDARIAGVKEVREWKGGPIERFMEQYFGPALAIGFVLLMGYVLVMSFIKEPQKMSVFFGALLLFFGLIYVIARFKKRYKHPMDE